jgi:hypothetical protein
MKDTLAELRQVAERKGVSASKIAETGIADHLRVLRGDSLDNGRPLATVTLQKALPSGWGMPVMDGEVERQMRLARGDQNMPQRPPPPPPTPYTTGGMQVTFDKPVTKQMAERLAQVVERELRLLWAEEAERIGASE